MDCPTWAARNLLRRMKRLSQPEAPTFTYWELKDGVDASP